MKKFLLFFAFTVTLVNFSYGFHAKVLVRKDGSISADGLQGHSNFEKTCIKDDYCTYNLKAPGIAPTDYNSDQNIISKGGQDFEGDQATYNQEIQTYTDFENGWKETSTEIDAMLRSIETINKQLPPILDAIEASLLNTSETYSKIKTTMGQISNGCYKSTCDKTTQAPPLTTQNPATQGTEVTQSPGSTVEAGTTTEFTGSTPSPGPTEPAASTTTGPTEASATGGSTNGASETTTTDSAADATTSSAGSDSSSTTTQ